MTTYLFRAEDAERRYKLGQRQRKCKCCKRWLWPGEYRKHGKQRKGKH